MALLLAFLLAALLGDAGAVVCKNDTYLACDDCGGSCNSETGCLCSDILRVCLPSACDMTSMCCPNGLFWHSAESCCSVEPICYPDCLVDEYCQLPEAVCKCNLTQYRGANISDVVPVLKCEYSLMIISFSKCLLEKVRYDPTHMHLLNGSNYCQNIYPDVVGGKAVYSNQILPFTGDCGNIVSKNDTYATYSNTMVIPANTAGLVTVPNLRYNFSCSYLLSMLVFLDTPLHVIISNVSLPIPLTATGSASVSMAAFFDSSYTKPILSTDELQVGMTFYFGLVTDFQDGDTFALRAENCYATPNAQPNSTTRVDLIIGGCAANQAVNTQVLENGQSLQVRFSAQAFAFQDYGQVFIFCNVRLCQKSTGTCAQCGSSRTSAPSAFLGVGPYPLAVPDILAGSSAAHTAVSWAVLGSTLLALMNLMMM